jgi:hypothetical protein
MLIDYSQRLLFFCRSHYERLCLAALFHRQTLALMYIRLIGSNLRWPTTIPYHHLFEVWRDMSPYEPY